MSALAVARLIISKMSSEEQKVARNFLKALSSRGSNAPSPTLALFDLLSREVPGQAPLEDTVLENLVYGRNSGTAFPRLILRLRDKLFESLLLSVNLEREGVYSERGQALHEIRKSISHAQILQSRGAWSVASAILDECIERAEKYEHYEELLSALRVRMEISAVNKGKVSLAAEGARYNKVMRCLIASKMALEYFHQLMAETEFKAGSVSLQKLTERIEELQAEFEVTRSANVAFFQNYLEVHLYQELGFYKSASIILKRQADLVEVHPAIYSKTRLAGVYVNLAWNEIYPRKFSSALKFSEKAKGLLNEKHFNYHRCLDTDFYCYFYLGKYEQALTCINSVLKDDNADGAEYRVGKREYQKACVLFMLRKHEQVLSILTSLNPIEDDDEGWNLSLRTLHIMNDIEMGKTDNARRRVENMRKHLEKLKKSNSEVPRQILKYEVLRMLVITRFDFLETRKRRSEELAKLTQTKQPHSWKILSSELIIFNQWFESKIFRQPLKMKIPDYESTILNKQKITEEMAAEADFPKSKLLITKK